MTHHLRGDLHLCKSCGYKLLFSITYLKKKKIYNSLFCIFNFHESHPRTVHIFQKEHIFQYSRQHLPVQETSQVALEELSKYISVRTQTILGNQSEKQVIIALRKPSNMSGVGGKQSYSPTENVFLRWELFYGNHCEFWNTHNLFRLYTVHNVICPETSNLSA